jgi:hypothetical protein
MPRHRSIAGSVRVLAAACSLAALCGSAPSSAVNVATQATAWTSPVTIGGTHAEGSNRLGPFADSTGAIYFMDEIQPIPPEPEMWKSSDGGATWAVVDEPGAPTGGTIRDLESVWIAQSAGTLHIVRQRSGTAGAHTAYVQFSTSDHPTAPDRWGAVETVNTVAIDPDDQACSIVRNANGGLYVFYRGAPSVSGGIPATRDERVFYRKRSAGGAWGPEQTVAATAGISYTQIQAIPGLDGTTIHVLYKDHTNANIVYRTLDTRSDTLSSARTLNTSATHGVVNPMATPAVALHAAGTERIVVAWANAAGLLVATTIDNGVIRPNDAVSDRAVWIGGGQIRSKQPVATLAADETTGRVYALYADAATHDIYQDVRDSSWGVDVEALDAVEAQYISANIIQRTASRDLAMIYDDNPTGLLDAGVPTYSALRLSAPGGNSAPLVNAGPDLTITLPAVASLDGTVVDDRLPNPPGATTTTWAKVSGPGTVTFASSTAVDTTASFSTAGSYVLRLRASDGALATTDEVAVTVRAAPAGGDAIFADGFESGSFSAWSSAATDAGDLSVATQAARVGTLGMRALLDDNRAVFVTDNSPASEPRYRARFYLHPNSLPMASGNNFLVAVGRGPTGAVALRLLLRWSGSQYLLRTAVASDGGPFVVSPWTAISGTAWNAIEIDWRAATGLGANNGGLTLWIDGVQKANLSQVDNDTHTIDRVQLGAVSGIDFGTRGTLYFDAFESRRQTYIGP